MGYIMEHTQGSCTTYPLSVKYLIPEETFGKTGREGEQSSMFSFLGLRKDPKKSTSERDADGGFVIIACSFAGETVEEQRRKVQSMNIAQPSTNVIVLPSKPSCPAPARPVETITTPPPTNVEDGSSSVTEASSMAPDLLGDIPFALAPHVQAVQRGFPYIPDVLLSKDMNSSLTYFHYDFTLEKSILQM
ncbi:UBAP1-MVB12-associated (UMA)-domain containing protein 1 isoform X1 [Syngnathus acus]|uniref:UBAP1-MVB12-associated (UMA)-domain containing protein 1 isoform X1 n=2 Tax=Syngnathus acus TaxID=161584 RepID=UPI001885C897|nr:UBAP1-MVB12-associated (UMA)-domain containing protein 1 isoform X1 [Syngnathus acus]